MITKFKSFEQKEKNFENVGINEIDPYGEENWGGPEELEIEIITPKISDDKQDSFWYFGEIIAILRKQDIEIEIAASGQIAVNFKSDVYYNEEAVEFANNNSLTDKDLEKIRNTIGFINNNWFEFRINGEYTDDFGGDVAYEYDEAINAAKAMLDE
jgi:hypothetical protein